MRRGRAGLARPSWATQSLSTVVFPNPAGARHQRQPVARIEGGVELLGQSGARDGLRAPGRREQLRGEHRSRHPRIIGAGA